MNAAAVIASRHNAVVFELVQRLRMERLTPGRARFHCGAVPLRSLPVNSRLRMWATAWSPP